MLFSTAAENPGVRTAFIQAKVQSFVRASGLGLGLLVTICFSSCFLDSPCEWERKWCVCAVCCEEVGSGGVEVRWGDLESQVRKIELQRMCVCVCLCLYTLSESVSCSCYTVVCKHRGNSRRQPKQYILSLSLVHTHKHSSGWNPVCACPHSNTPICLAAPHIDWSASQTQSHKGWPRFQHMHTQAGCREKYDAHLTCVDVKFTCICHIYIHIHTHIRLQLIFFCILSPWLLKAQSQS